MPTAVNAILPVVNAQGVASEVAFQPGSVIAGRVLSVSPDNQVRVAIGHSTIDVQSQVPLKAGQVLQFAVSKTDDGNVRLAVITPQSTGAGGTAGSAAGGAPLVPDAPVNLANAIASSKIQLTPLEAMAVSTATQTAVTQQASLATLFANLGAATSLKNLPPQLQQAVAQVLAQRPPLDTQLTGGEVKSAFQNSGLFLEASLAKGAVSQGGVVPDMKAALIVLRQALTATLGATGDTKAAAPPAANREQGAPALGGAPTVATTTGNAQAQAAAAMIVASLLPKTTTKADMLQQAGLPAAGEVIDADAATHAPAMPLAGKPSEAAARPAVNGATLSLLQEALQTAPKGMGSTASLVSDDNMMMELLPSAKAQPAPHGGDATLIRSNVPPPPLRGGLPTAQPMLTPTLAANAPLDATAHHLLADTDAALARQTLLQVASLPDRADGMAPRPDQASPRWSFEIPFAVPNGTAMAQFEIARDGGNGTEVEPAKHVWRARFSLDVEPAGPVHALVSLTGEKTSVRMWAERQETALQLRAGMAQLNQALVRANLQPGDIVVREGAPVQPVPASAGHFLDRAL